jgi:hypothetical protein
MAWAWVKVVVRKVVSYVQEVKKAILIDFFFWEGEDHSGV